MEKRFMGLVWTLLLILPGFAFSLPILDPEAWERDEAWRASASVNTQHQKDRLHQLMKVGDDAGSLRLIREIEQQADWPAPARERLIYEYVTSLRQETPNAVGPEVIGYLREFVSTVWVPHEDHPQATVPLFNIKGATVGLVNEWSRQEAAFEGAALIASNPGQLVRAYETEQGLAKRRGLLDALSTASPVQLRAISDVALTGISRNPGLIAVAGVAAIRNADIEALTELAEKGRGAEMNHVFRDSAMLLDTGQNHRLLEAALRNPSHEIAALAIAQLSPSLTGHAPTEELLLRTLSDRNLGASAALALAMNPSPRVLQSLERLAGSKGNEVSVSRARLALQIHASRFRSKAQP